MLGGVIHNGRRDALCARRLYVAAEAGAGAGAEVEVEVEAAAVR